MLGVKFGHKIFYFIKGNDNNFYEPIFIYCFDISLFTSLGGTLAILMWKHALCRTREYFSAFFEFVFPIFPFLLIYFLKYHLFPVTLTTYADVDKYIGVEKPETMSINDIRGPPCVLYTPDTAFTNRLMSLVGQKLKLPLLKSLRGRPRGYFPFNNANATNVFRYTRHNMGPTEAVVVFHNVSLLGLPEKLSYSIRMKKNDFHTDQTLLTREDDENERVLLSHHEYGKIYETFMKLQWAIDTSYIQMLTGENVNQSMKLQAFPHLKYAARKTSFVIKADVLFLAAIVAVLPTFYMFMLRNTLEKASGVQELMKMMGVTSWTLALGHGLNAFIPGLIYVVGATVLMKIQPNPVLEKANSFLIVLALLLHLIFTICSALVSCYMARRAPPTALTVSSVYVLLALPTFIMNFMGVSKFMVYPSGLLPFMPLAWIFKEASKLEFLGPGLTYNTMMTAHFGTSGSVFLAYIFFILQILLCLLLFWYFDHVIPGIYGSTHPWYFIFKKDYWRKKPPVPIEKLEQMIIPTAESKYFEAPPKHLEAGIRVINVTKDYDLHRALNNLSLDVYKEEITILLGHNGAGKSTLMSVITGMTGMTSGTVLVNGLDITSETTRARQHIGFCPQQNMFFENITVLEHVMFYTMLNGGTFTQARKTSKELLEKLHLGDKANNDTSELSGGMQRRVQLACALAGQASVLLLDEPTSGLDVETRRALWDLLISLRGSHTLLLSTHYMEEADALGDRVAALHAGNLRCHATPMYLKRAIGSGYRLTFATTGVPNEPVITEFLKTLVTGVKVKQTTFKSISYNLPADNTKIFPELFQKLEARRTELGIETIGVGTATLEDVFLRLCSNVDIGHLSQDELQGRKAPSYGKLTGLALVYSQMCILMKRYMRFLWIYKFTQIGLGVIRVVILILIITVITNDTTAGSDGIQDKNLLAMNLDMYRPSPEFRVLYKINGSDSDLRPLSDQYPRVQFEKAADVAEAALRAGHADEMEYGNYLAGLELNNTDAKVLYTTTIRHAAPVALNLMSNLLAKRAIPWAGGSMITAYNHPLVEAYMPYSAPDITEPKSITNIKLWLFSTTTMLLSGIIFMVQLPCAESSGARHIHILAGCSPETHWMTMLLSAVIQVLLTYVVTLAIACSLLDLDHTFSELDFIVAASFSVVTGSMAMLAFSYNFTFHFSQSSAVAMIAIIMVFFVLVFPIIVSVTPSANRIKPFALLAMPPYTFNEAMMGSSMTAYLNTLCKLNRQKCPALAFPIPHFNAEKCCQSNTNPWCYFCFQEPAPGKKFVYLVVQTFVYMILVILTQRGFFCVMWEKITNFRYKKPAFRYNDPAVIKERMYVEETIKLPPDRIPDMMLVSKVHKNYNRICSSFNAVKGVSFSVKKGECFGLLGVNGAGKSTMFHMLTAELCPTKGRVIANGEEMTVPYTTNYIHSMGYCPQFWVLDDFLTGRQNLMLLLTLNGLNQYDAMHESTTWIKLLGLEKYTDRLVSGYSSGCLRRMAAASALCTSAPVTFLDEPTAGVDVAARRKVWHALKRGLRDQNAIIITSHCLDEIEELCHRVLIMSAGEVCALGTSAELRAAHALGHSIILKIRHEPTEQQKIEFAGASNPRVDKLKNAVESKFKCTLKDEHKTMLHYHINEVMHYSKLFEEMEHLLATFPDIIEDYSVSETTLEEVFLSFAKPKTHDKLKTTKKVDVAAGPS